MSYLTTDFDNEEYVNISINVADPDPDLSILKKKNRPSHVVAGHRVQCLYKRKVNRKTLFYKKQSIDNSSTNLYEGGSI